MQGTNGSPITTVATWILVKPAVLVGLYELIRWVTLVTGFQLGLIAINGCLAASGIPQCCEASFQRKRSERLAQNFTTDSVDDNVCAVTAGDATHAVTQLLLGAIDDFVESERLRLLGFRMFGGA